MQKNPSGCIICVIGKYIKKTGAKMLDIEKIKFLSDKIYNQLVVLRLCCKHADEMQNLKALYLLANSTCALADKLNVEFLENDV